jgi:TRAP-type C4-dicarboxylate transport system permease small subunit
MLKTLSLAFDKANRVLSSVSAAFVVVMVVSILYDVFARLLFHAPTIWVIDMNEYLLVYLTFVPAAWILMNDHHVKVELLTVRLSPAPQRRLRVVTDILGLIYCIVLTWQAWEVAWHAFENGYRFSTALNFPKFPVLVIIPIGAAWLGLGFVFRILAGSRAPAALTPGEGGL